jgi:glycosyltransferase involved in cell wall biosynthesis
MTIKTLSLIIPAYKQEKTIVNDICRLNNVLKKLSFNYEIILVVDGCDNTYKSALRIKNSKVRIFKYKKNHGKGYAVRFGVNKAKGDVIGFIDGGRDINPISIYSLLDVIKKNNADIVVGSKLHPESKIDYPLFRRVLSWGYRNMTYLIFGFNVKDTQVGLKFFKRDVAKKVFAKAKVNGFAFDVEALAIANLLGYKKIYDAPVKLNFNKEFSAKKSRFIKIIPSMLWDTIMIFIRLKIFRTY